MTHHSIACNPFLTNCYIVHDGQAGVLIDPSCQRQSEIDRVLGYIRAEALTIDRVLLTHGHLDHIFGCAPVCQALDVGYYMHRADEPLIAHALQQAMAYGIAMEAPPRPAGFLAEGDTVTVGTLSWEVLHIPGHSPGSICFYDAEHRALFSGDVVFQDSIGRTDLWQGSLPELMASIFQKLLPLGDDVAVYPGHGPETTLGRERTHNPFLVTENA